MGYVNSSPDDEYRLMSVAAANPVTELTPEHWYDGLAGAVPRGVVGAGLKAYQAFNDVADPIDRFLGRDEYLKEEGLGLPKSWEEYAKPDARWQGTPARILQGVTEGLGLAATGAAMGGPVGAAAMIGGVEGDATYREQVAAGVDHGTAMKVAGITGAVNALGAFLPMTVAKSTVMGLMGKGMQAEVAGNETLAKLLYGAADVAAPAAGKISTAVNVGVASNLTFGMGQRSFTGDILRENGYPELADQYKTFDTESVMADVVLGAAFGAFAHFSDPHAVPPSDVDGAMAVKKQEHYDNSGLGIHSDPLSVQTHDAVLSRSIEDLVLGKTPSLSASEAEILTRDVIADPTIEAAVSLQHEALAEAFDAKHEIGAVERLPEAPIIVNGGYVNTRGGSDRFHGTGAPINELSDQVALQATHDKNIYGDGFYTTDAVDMAAGYTKKGGKEPTLYKVEEAPVKLFDMEAPIDGKTRATVEDILGEYYPYKNGADETHFNNLREILDAFRDESAGNGLPRYEVQEYFHEIRSALEKEGYRGYRHTGGLRTKNEPHDVKIFWTPEQDVKITKTDLESYRQPAAPQAEAPKIQMNEMARETMTQLAASNPDLMLRLGDGREVKMADLPTILQEHAMAAEKDSVLHDVAAACYIRTTL